MRQGPQLGRQLLAGVVLVCAVLNLTTFACVGHYETVTLVRMPYDDNETLADWADEYYEMRTPICVPHPDNCP